MGRTTIRITAAIILSISPFFTRGLHDDKAYSHHHIRASIRNSEVPGAAGAAARQGRVGRVSTSRSKGVGGERDGQVPAGVKT